MRLRVLITTALTIALALAVNAGVPALAALPRTTSPNLAGAVVYGSAAKQMSAVWVVPAATCPLANMGSFVELGNFGVSANNPELSAAGVNINCTAGIAQYVPYTYHGLESTPERDYGDKVTPGDLITLRISSTSGALRATVADLTRRWIRSWNITPGTTDDIVGGQLGLNAVHTGPHTTLPLTEIGDTPVRSPAAYHTLFVLDALAGATPINRLVPAGAPAVKLLDLSADDGSTRAVTSELGPLGGFSITWLKADGSA